MGIPLAVSCQKAAKSTSLGSSSGALREQPWAQVSWARQSPPGGWSRPFRLKFWLGWPFTWTRPCTCKFG